MGKKFPGISISLPSSKSQGKRGHKKDLELCSPLVTLPSYFIAMEEGENVLWASLSSVSKMEP